MKRTVRLGILIVAAALAAAGCQKKTQIQGVSLDVAFAEPVLSDNLITDITYTWKTGSDFLKFDREYHVFVHFWHNENLIFQDDHAPDPATAEWEKDKAYTITRRIYIPKFIDEFDPQFKGEESLRLVVGLVNPYDRSGDAPREVMTRKLKVLPPPIGTPEVIYESGWYDLEVDQNNPLKQWRWTAKEAKCIIDNPRRDALLVIKGGANISDVKDPKIILKINGLAFDEFVPNEGLFEKSYEIQKEMLGDKDEFTLSIGVSESFIPSKINPSSQDDRELGLQVSFIYFR
ncbi:MAG: hypothetical protein JW843_07170 [Candidatus Aminicenantes bacterium]|nr:hypothetical protein [Candidatus Aminicenantes bacterium]